MPRGGGVWVIYERTELPWPWPKRLGRPPRFSIKYLGRRGVEETPCDGSGMRPMGGSEASGSSPSFKCVGSPAIKRTPEKRCSVIGSDQIRIPSHLTNTRTLLCKAGLMRKAMH